MNFRTFAGLERGYRGDKHAYAFICRRQHFGHYCKHRPHFGSILDVCILLFFFWQDYTVWINVMVAWASYYLLHWISFVESNFSSIYSCSKRHVVIFFLKNCHRVFTLLTTQKKNILTTRASEPPAAARSWNMWSIALPLGSSIPTRGLGTCACET